MGFITDHGHVKKDQQMLVFFLFESHAIAIKVSLCDQLTKSGLQAFWVHVPAVCPFENAVLLSSAASVAGEVVLTNLCGQTVCFWADDDLNGIHAWT